jgi:hypothetical protein
MAFRISANLGERKPFFRFNAADPGNADIEVVIDDRRIDRMEASRLLRGIANRLLECHWPPAADRRGDDDVAALPAREAFGVQRGIVPAGMPRKPSSQPSGSVDDNVEMRLTGAGGG